MEENKNDGSAIRISALVLGIISIVANFFWYIAIPTGILAIVFGVKSIKRTESKMGKAGLITGIVGVALCVFTYVSLTLLLVLANY
ncbi:MAG: hypothetical protein IKF17_05510 [Clostridia bacterium]|nr:hypothetical protein [Clostridia bacterium]